MLAHSQGLQLCNVCVLVHMREGREVESSFCSDVLHWAARDTVYTHKKKIQEQNNLRGWDGVKKHVCVCYDREHLHHLFIFMHTQHKKVLMCARAHV